jgi:proline iminopeptidase
MKKVLFVLAAYCLLSCNESASSTATTGNTTDTISAEIKTGGNRLVQVDGKYNVWIKKVGEGMKVLLLHGGPGAPHDYMECYESFLPKEGIEIYYYDQLGCGNSDFPADTSLWNISRYVEEVEQVRKALGLENFYIAGHSWGGMLAMEYLHKYQSHVKGAVLSNMTAGMQDFLGYTAQLKEKLFSKRDIALYDSLDKLKKYASPEYSDLLMNKLYSQVLCRLPMEQWPEPLLRSFKKLNHTIYEQMQGVDEFHVTGNFRNWEFWDKLPELKIPILVLGAQNDEMNPESMKKEGRLLPNSHTYICPNGSHMAMYDDQQNYFSNLISFLKAVDNGSFTPDKK